MNYVLDTDIITAILKDNEKVKGKLNKAVLDGDEIFVNAISYWEIKRGFLAINAVTSLNAFIDFCKNFPVLLIDTTRILDEAADMYAYLQRKGELIGDADILIASIVKVQNFILVTNNTAHFQRIQGLSIENWIN
jgi:tRNA(fMet)-specific endonuclease VapC